MTVLTTMGAGAPIATVLGFFDPCAPNARFIVDPQKLSSDQKWIQDRIDNIPLRSLELPSDASASLHTNYNVVEPNVIQWAPPTIHPPGVPVSISLPVIAMARALRDRGILEKIDLKNARFTVHPHALEGDPTPVNEAIGNIPIGELIILGLLPSFYANCRVIHPEMGIIEFDPIFGGRGWLPLVDAVRNALEGSELLPEPLTARASWSANTKDYVEGLWRLLAGLHTIGGKLEHRKDMEHLAEAVDAGAFFSNFVARWETGDVGFKASIRVLFHKTDLEGPSGSDNKDEASQFKLTELGAISHANGLTYHVYMTASLLHEAHRNSLQGHEVLEKGLREFLLPLIDYSSPLQLQVSFSEIAGQNLLDLVCDPDLEISDQVLEQLQITRGGVFTGDLGEQRPCSEQVGVRARELLPFDSQ